MNFQSFNSLNFCNFLLYFNKFVKLYMIINTQNKCLILVNINYILAMLVAIDGSD